MTLTEDILSQLPGNALAGLRHADSLWKTVREGTIPVPEVIKQNSAPIGSLDWDVVICGGTLGILLGTALAQLGWRVALIERGILRGREQEWNISRQELQVFVEMNLLTEQELEKAIATEYNPGRVSFLGGADIWVRDILNIGVDPVFLLDTLKSKFLAAGGKLFENTPFAGAEVHPDGVMVKAADGLKTRLLIDAMGHFSPIAQQARQGKKPEGICLVVGTCAQGFPKNETGDLLVSFTPIQNQCQYFWEAFPARDGRTTYLFTYMDAHPDRFSLEFFFAEYLRLLPQYQNIELSQLQFKRALFGFFPAYRQSPLRMPWERILPIGDSSGSQSPVSFGGFGAMVRHLQRLTQGTHAALESNALSQTGLALLQPYQPNIAVTWMFQRAMSVDLDRAVDPNQINRLLAGVFQVMEKLGDDVLRPFLQDVIQFSGLLRTLSSASLQPQLVLPIIPQIGVPTLLDWLVNYINLGTYSALYPFSKLSTPVVKSLPPAQKYYCHRFIDAWKYGSGNDYHA